MLTGNGKALLKINRSSDRASNLPLTLKKIDGAAITISSDASSLISNILSNMNLKVGTGSTEPTKDDYTLTNADAGLTVVSSNGTNTNDGASYEQNYVAIFTKTYANNTDQDVVVSEVGVYSGYSYGGTQYTYLFTRDAFDPVTIAPGETYTFTARIG